MVRDDSGNLIICGKCKSASLYFDSVPGIDATWGGIVCFNCGNREGSTWGFIKVGGDDMGKTGTCVNCKRDGIRMADGSDMCHQCTSYVTGTKDPEARSKKLAEAAELYGSLKPGEKLPRGRVQEFRALHGDIPAAVIKSVRKGKRRSPGKPLPSIADAINGDQEEWEDPSISFKAGHILRILYPKGINPVQYYSLLDLIRNIDCILSMAFEISTFSEKKSNG